MFPRAALYLERWETETTCDEVKTHILGLVSHRRQDWIPKCVQSNSAPFKAQSTASTANQLHVVSNDDAAGIKNEVNARDQCDP